MDNPASLWYTCVSLRASEAAAAGLVAGSQVGLGRGAGRRVPKAGPSRGAGRISEGTQWGGRLGAGAWGGRLAPAWRPTRFRNGADGAQVAERTGKHAHPAHAPPAAWREHPSRAREFQRKPLRAAPPPQTRLRDSSGIPSGQSAERTTTSAPSTCRFTSQSLTTSTICARRRTGSAPTRL